MPRPTLTSLRRAVKPLAWVAAILLLFIGVTGAFWAILHPGDEAWAIIAASTLLAFVSLLLMLTLAAQYKVGRELDEARHHAHRLRDEMDKRARSIGDTAQLDREWDEARQRHIQAMQAHTLMIASHQEDLQTTHDAIEHLRRKLHEGLASERSARIVALARRDAGDERKDPPRRWLLIVAPQRTGSTWLLDALRCHPRIALHPTPHITRLLGMGDIGRYPQGLSDAHADTAADVTQVEVRDGVGAMVPRFDPPEALQKAARDLPAWVVEKVHPEFFDWDAAAFAARLDALEREHDVEVRVAYRLRDPRGAVRSMLRYKRREPRWYSHIPADDVPAFMARTFEAVQQLTTLRPGPVLDYARGEADPTDELRRVFTWLWASSDEAIAGDIATWAAEITGKESRSERRPGTFLSTPAAEAHADDETLLRTHGEELQRCDAAYRAMLSFQEIETTDEHG